MNLGINKVEGELIYDAIIYYFKQTKVPKALLGCYPGADVENILTQLKYIKMIGEESDAEIKRFTV